MSVFGSIFSAIFGASPAHASTPAAQGTATATSGPAPAASVAMPSGGVGGTTSGAPAPATMEALDVAAVLDDKTAAKGEDLDWRKSIVDLMKVLDLDSGLPQRRALAAELGFTGDSKDTAAMNVWLHKQVMTKLAANGGMVPADLRD